MDTYLYSLSEKKLKSSTLMLRERVLLLNARMVIEKKIIQSKTHDDFDAAFTQKRKSINKREGVTTSKRALRIELQEHDLPGRSQH